MSDQKFITILRSHLRYLSPAEELAPDTPLRELGLDSMVAVALLLDLENEFGVTLPDSSLRPETFESANHLWAEVEKAAGL
jgi:acyl carrier protein